MKDLPLSDLHDYGADLSDDVVGHANNDVDVVEEAVLERLAGVCDSRSAMKLDDSKTGSSTLR